MSDGFKEIDPPVGGPQPATVNQVAHGHHIPPQQQILLYSAADWEAFIHEWAYFCLKKEYVKVQRFSGAGDKGIDIAGFVDKDGFRGVWDNYQCKHYSRTLGLGDACPEIGKVLWYSFSGDYTSPRRYFFAAPLGVGTKLKQLLADSDKLKQALIKNWDKHARRAITDSQEIVLDGDFLKYVENFDFSIFSEKNGLELIDGHRGSPYHAARFGGGLPTRPAAGKPPVGITPKESRYVAQLLAAYADHMKKPIGNLAALKSPKLKEHLGRQREAFYHAEALRVFARDTVPQGTFEGLQEDIYTGVIDEHDANHPDGYARVLKVTKVARELPLTSNALLTCSGPKDREGICHQLANEDRLKWTRP